MAVAYLKRSTTEPLLDALEVRRDAGPPGRHRDSQRFELRIAQRRESRTRRALLPLCGRNPLDRGLKPGLPRDLAGKIVPADRSSVDGVIEAVRLRRDEPPQQDRRRTWATQPRPPPRVAANRRGGTPARARPATVAGGRPPRRRVRTCERRTRA